MDTRYYKSKNITPLNNLIDKYSLQLRLDDFGMGTEVYYKDELVGYWFQWEKGIEFRCTMDFGGQSFNCDDWEMLCKGIEGVLLEQREEC